MDKARVVTLALWLAAAFFAAVFLVGVLGVILSLRHVEVTVVAASASPPQPRGDAVMHVGPGGSGGPGAVEEVKGFYAGRPLFKVPPSSPCREKDVRC